MPQVFCPNEETLTNTGNNNRENLLFTSLQIPTLWPVLPITASTRH